MKNSVNAILNGASVLDLLQEAEITKNKKEKKKKKDSKSIVWDFFKENPNPTDDEFHAFAEENGIEPDDFEEVVYSIISSIASKGKAVEAGLTAGDIDPKELAAGIKIEMEHTDNAMIAERIVLDHEAETPNKDYYLNPVYGLYAMEEKIKKTSKGEKDGN